MKYQVIDIDVLATEVLLEDDNGNPIPVDLRGKYLDMARNWKTEDILRADLTYARSRYTPWFLFLKGK